METRCGRPKRPDQETFVHQAIVTVTFVAFIALFLWFLWYASPVILLIFAAVLLALFLNGLAAVLQRLTKLPRKLSLVLVILVLLTFLILSVWILVPRVFSQLDILSQQLARTVEHLESTIGGYDWGKKILEKIPNIDQLIRSMGKILIQTFGIFATAVGAVASLAIVLLVSLYLAFDPQTYRRGILRLIPRDHRPRADEVLQTLGVTLTRWMIGRFCAMLFVGCFVALGLSLLETRLALTLGLIAALLDFVPNIGPIIAALPVVLLTLPEGPTKVLYVVTLYLVVLSIEGYAFTPLIQRRQISLPPVLTLVSQIVLGFFFGVLGLVLATPLVACGIVLVRMIYIEDILGDTPTPNGSVYGTEEP